MRYGYARISTDDQHLDRQRHLLVSESCDQVVEEVESGAKARRRLDTLVASLQAGDELMVEQIDRLGRTAGATILLMDELHRRGVKLRVLSLPLIDYDTPSGRFVAMTFAALAELFRSEQKLRQRQGIEAARRAGRHLGRKQKMNGQQVAEARQRIEDGEAVRVVARAYNVTPKTLRATLARRNS